MVKSELNEILEVTIEFEENNMACGTRHYPISFVTTIANNCTATKIKGRIIESNFTDEYFFAETSSSIEVLDNSEIRITEIRGEHSVELIPLWLYNKLKRAKQYFKVKH